MKYQLMIKVDVPADDDAVARNMGLAIADRAVVAILPITGGYKWEWKLQKIYPDKGPVKLEGKKC